MPTPFLIQKNTFRSQKVFEAQKCSPTKCVGTVSQKHRWGSSFPPPFFSLTFFDIKSFLKHKRVPLKNVSLLWNKHFRSTMVMSALFFILNIFRYQNVFETKKSSSTKCLATEKQTISKHSCDAHTLSFFNIFFHLEFFLKHRRVPWRKVSVLWNKIVLRRILIPLSPFWMKSFWTRMFLKRWRVPYEMFRYSETKKFEDNCDAHPLSFP